MLKNLLREIIVLTVGKQAEPIAELLENNKHINEFVIAKKLNLTINQTRNILYKISNYGLVSSIRKKDKRKGWYTYFWKFEVSKCLEFLKNLLVEDMKILRKQIHDRKSATFYVCRRCSLEANGEEALLMNFTCRECGDVFSVKDDSKLIKDFEKNLEKLEEKLKFVNIEIEKESAVSEKQKQKELRREQKEKEEKRALAAKERRKALQKKFKKVIVKKISSKKPTKKNSIAKKIKKKQIKGKKSALKKKLSKKKAVKKKK